MGDYHITTTSSASEESNASSGDNTNPSDSLPSLPGNPVNVITGNGTSAAKTATNTTYNFMKSFGYSLGCVIGEGSYAKVRKAIDVNGELLAIKIISKSRAPKDFLEKFMPRELDMLRKVQHEHIIKIYEMIEYGDKVFVVMELAETGDLLEYVKVYGAIPNENARRMFRELVQAVSHCHALNIAHRDLKCENLLLDRNMHIKLTDFGFARECTNAVGRRVLSDTYCGSAAYASPEVLQGQPYNPKMYDVWSLGCVLYIMVTGSMPFDDSDMKRMLRAQLEKPVGFPEKVHHKLEPDCKKLIHHMLQPDVTERATVWQIIRHPWVAVTTSTLPPPPSTQAPVYLNYLPHSTGPKSPLTWRSGGFSSSTNRWTELPAVVVADEPNHVNVNNPSLPWQQRWPNEPADTSMNPLDFRSYIRTHK